MAAAHDLLDPTTIVAVATPPGRGGIGVVRISGPAAFGITKLLLPKFSESDPRSDDALITAFPALPSTRRTVRNLQSIR